jgi:hypothetical protein
MMTGDMKINFGDEPRPLPGVYARGWQVPPKGMAPAGTRPNRPPNTHTATFFPSVPFFHTLSLSLSRPLCLHAGESACSSQNHLLPSSKLLNPILTNMFTISLRRVKYSKPTSKHPPQQCHTFETDAFPFYPQDLCCTHVILPPETVPVRGHWQKRS